VPWDMSIRIEAFMTEYIRLGTAVDQTFVIRVSERRQSRETSIFA
jgi:hypothetical protein